jgi:hypothetical protein
MLLFSLKPLSHILNFQVFYFCDPQAQFTLQPNKSKQSVARLSHSCVISEMKKTFNNAFKRWLKNLAGSTS